MESVLGDRCIPIILEKSNRKEVTNLIEIFDEEEIVVETKKLLEQCSLCICSFSGKLYKEWNTYLKKNYTNYINYLKERKYTNYTQVFETIKSMDLNGRELELSFPLCMVASEISEEILKKTTLTLKRIFLEKKEEELVENYDVNLIDFTSQKLQNNDFYSVSNYKSTF